MLRILVVEDDLILATDIKEILEENECEVTLARNYSEAMGMFSKHNPDAVFLDITLQFSALNGIQIAEEIRKNNDQVPFIFISAHSENSTVNKAYAVKPFQYLVKPFNQNQIEVEISRLRKRLQAELANSEESKKLLESETLFLPLNGSKARIDKREIIYIRSFEGYTEIYLQTQSSPFRSSNKMKEILALLPEDKFVQIHRSYAINLQHLISFDANEVKMRGVTNKLPISANRKTEFDRMLPIVKTRM